MDYLKDLHEMCEVLSRELGEANDKVRQNGGKLSGSDLEYIDRLTHAIKSIKTTIAMMEAEDGNSYDGYPANMSYYGGSYRGRRRDSMGRYSSRYSRDDHMISELHDLMNQAPDENTRKEFERFIAKIERM